MRFFKRHKIFSIILVILSIYIYTNYTIIFNTTSNIDKNDKYYVNDIYISDGRIYKNFLTEDEKKAYDELVEMAIKRSSARKIDLTKYQEKDPSNLTSVFITAHEAILIDHPELLQYASFSGSYTNSKLKISIKYATNNPIEEEINTLKIRVMINDIKKKTANMTDLEKIKYVYEWIGDNSTYDTVFTYTSKNQSIYNVFIKKNAVCAGFAKASQVIFQNIGIESMGIIGESTGPHMWNIIKYKGKYYYYDSTYAASINDKTNAYYYNGLNQESMNSYTMSHPEWYPKIEEKSFFSIKE